MPEIDEIPRYRLIMPFFAEDSTLYPEGAELRYDGNPNEYMEPLNEAARQRMIPILAGLKKAVLGGDPKGALGDQVQQAHEALHARDRAAAEPSQVVFPVLDKTIPMTTDPLAVTPGARPRGRPKKVIEATLPPQTGIPGQAKNLMGTVILQGQDGAVNTGGGLNR